jgi:hypothetical protein
MSLEEARGVVKDINDSVIRSGILLREYRDREGWRVMGYASFKAACEKEFRDIYGCRSQVYRLMQQDEVAQNVGAPAVSTQVSRQIGKLPPEEQKAAYQAAGGSEATGETSAAEVEKRTPKKKAKSKPDKSKAPNKDAGGKYAAAIERIKKVCGAEVSKAVQNGILDHVTEKAAIYWAGLKDSDMADIQELVVSKRWDPKRAFAAINKMVTADTKIEELINLCVAGSGTWEGTVNGFDIVVKQSKRRK